MWFLRPRLPVRPRIYVSFSSGRPPSNAYATIQSNVKAVAAVISGFLVSIVVASPMHTPWASWEAISKPIN